ncbi:hypothetical protein ACSRUE_33340 [Sorangium sp. KYC3313]|uniref:hypothetical protein n=1 Tax=Sorangium sp. KYC3313 TaxID=3449740 RepID=UPI003F89CF87
MSRDAHIPLALWICAAIVAHMAGGGGAVEVAQVIEDRAQLRQMIHAVRDGLRPGDTTFEILTDGATLTPPPAPLAPPELPSDSEPDKDGTPDPQQPKPEPTKAAAIPPRKPPKAEPPRQAKAPPPAPPKPEPPKEEVAKIVPVQPAPPPPLPPADRRIAVRQHVQKDQQDNPEANRIADDANKVDEETMAQIRSKDQDDPEPTPGTPSGPKAPTDRVGDSDHDHSGHSEERAGNEKHAPGEGNPESESAEHHSPASPAQAAQASRAAPPPSVPGASGGARVAQVSPALPPPEKGAAGGSGPASPEVIDGARGGYTLNPANPGGDGKSRVAGKKATPQPYQTPVRVGSIGLGAPGLPSGPNLNLDMAGVQAAVGNEKLRAERASDGASRKSAHRGSWETTDKWKKWRAAIENYDPSVKPGNQTSLNAARVPFATYINMIHNRLHPIFAEEFLASLDSLPSGHAFNQNRITHVEIVLNKDSGSVVRLGVTRPSGMTAFDIVALNSVHRASPFGKAPDAIVSPDGNVYLHWEFHRDPYDACSTRNARPFLLKAPSGAAPIEPAPVRKGPRPVPGDEGAPAPPGPLLPLRR